MKTTMIDIMMECERHNLHCSFTRQRINDYSVEIYQGYIKNYTEVYLSDGHVDPLECINNAVKFLNNNYNSNLEENEISRA